MKSPFKTIALIGKHRAPEIARPLLRLADFLSGKGVEVVVDSLTSEHLNLSSYIHLNRTSYTVVELEEMDGKMDLAIVLGGDGTMLNIARTLAQFGVPLVGVNQGRLGFLTDISLDNMLQTIGEMLEGKYITEQRMLLTARVLRGDAEVGSSLALNDVVVHRDNINNMIEFEVRIDGEYLYNQRADGLIVSTPTGSTAYALSSGGPILHPSLDVIELAPVCPHVLSNRPIVVKGNSVIEIEVLVRHTNYVRVRFDSHTYFDLQDKDKLEVTRYPSPVHLLHPLGHSYYHTLREKLLWNKAP
jgi:NAD+ kinase